MGATLNPADNGSGNAEHSSRSEDSLRTTHLRLAEAWRERDAAEISASYSADALLLIPGELPVKGSATAASFILKLLAEPRFSLMLRPRGVRVSLCGTLGVVVGSYAQSNPTADGGSALETGHYLTSYVRPHGRWLIAEEINTPGPVAMTP